MTLANPVIISGGSVTLSGTALAGSNPTPLTLSGPVSFPSGTATATLTISNSATFSNVVSGTGTGLVTLAGLGTVSFTKTNTFKNPVTVNMANAAFLGVGGVFGSVVLGSNNGLGAGTNTLTLSSGALQSGVSGGVTLSNPITFSNSTLAFTGNNPLTFTGKASLSSTSGNTNTIEIQNALQTTVFGGVVSGTGSLTLVGRGTLTLQAANTNSGAVTISGGTLRLSGAGALTGLTASSTLTINTGGILALDNSGAAANNQTNRIADAAPIALAGGMIQLFGNATAATSETLGNVVLSRGQAYDRLDARGEHHEAHAQQPDSCVGFWRRHSCSRVTSLGGFL